jgi:hypothetical protein
MSQDSQNRRPPVSLYTQVDITAGQQSPQVRDRRDEQTELLQDILAAQDRSNELLEELVAAMTAVQKQRAAELNQWKQAHPELAQSCRRAAEGLSQVQVRFLDKMTEEVHESLDCLMDGEFMLSEFVDRFGPRLAHLNGVIQVLAQLSSIPNPTDTAP